MAKGVVFMKKAIVCLTIALAFLAMSSVPSSAGLCVDFDGFCDQYYLALNGLGGGVYLLNGYGYGCLTDADSYTGTLRLAGGNIYMGLQVTNGMIYDAGYMGVNNIIAPLATMSGDVLFTYVYMNGGVLDGHGGGTTSSLSLCSGPLPAEQGADGPPSMLAE